MQTPSENINTIHAAKWGPGPFVGERGRFLAEAVIEATAAYIAAINAAAAKVDPNDRIIKPISTADMADQLIDVAVDMISSDADEDDTVSDMGKLLPSLRIAEFGRSQWDKKPAPSFLAIAAAIVAPMPVVQS